MLHKLLQAIGVFIGEHMQQVADKCAGVKKKGVRTKRAGLRHQFDPPRSLPFLLRICLQSRCGNGECGGDSDGLGRAEKANRSLAHPLADLEVRLGTPAIVMALMIGGRQVTAVSTSQALFIELLIDD